MKASTPHIFCLLVLLDLFVIGIALPQAQADYILVAGIAYGPLVDVFKVNGEGQIRLPEYYSINAKKVASLPEVGIITCSPTGSKIYFEDWAGYEGAMFSVDADFHLNFIQNMGRQCAGSVFSPDEKYFITSTDFLNHPKHGTLALFEWNSSRFDLATTESVPTTATMYYPGVWTKRDEIFASSLQGYLNSFSGGALYQLDRSSNDLELKQYFSPRTSGIDFVDLNREENIIVFGGHQLTPTNSYLPYIGVIARNLQGSWEQKCTYEDPAWGKDYDISGIKLLPHSQSYAVVLLSGGDRQKGPGLWLYWINPNTYEMSAVAYLQFLDSSRFAMSPDGEFIAVSHDYNRRISIVEIDSSCQFQLRDTIYGPQIGRMAFLPRAFPKASANDACALYGDTPAGGTSASAKKSRPLGKPSIKPSGDAKRGEWTRIR